MLRKTIMYIWKILKFIIDLILNFFWSNKTQSSITDVQTTPVTALDSSGAVAIIQTPVQELKGEEELLKTFERISNCVSRLARKQRKLYKQDPLLQVEDFQKDPEQSNIRMFGGHK